MLWVYDGDLITSENAWRHFTNVQGLSSADVLAISVAECTTLDLPARPDPAPFREHAVIDFTSLGASQIERKAKKLQAFAAARGWQYRADGA